MKINILIYGGRKTGKPHNGIHGSHYSSSKTRNTKTNTETNSKINIDKDRLTYNLYDTKQTNLDEDQPCDGILCSPYPSSGLEPNSEACCLLVLPVHRKSLSFGRYKNTIPNIILSFGRFKTLFLTLSMHILLVLPIHRKSLSFTRCGTHLLSQVLLLLKHNKFHIINAKIT